jgi:hypothetical protein
MTLSIARNVEAKRVFPQITRHLYKSFTQETFTLDQRLAMTLLASSDQLTKWQKYFKRKRNARHCFNRALFMHRNAFELELGGYYQRADFFWQELYAELTTLFENEAAWLALGQSFASEQPRLEVLGDPKKLRASFIEELLIDTHAAFFNGYAKQAEQLTLESRAWKHLGYVMQLLEWSEWTSEDKFRLIKTAAEAEIRLLEEARRWKEVADRCQLLIRYCPNSIDYEELLWNANVSQRIDYHLNYQKRDRVNSIEAAIADFKQLRTNYPLSLPIYEKLGNLHYELAVSLAEGGYISSALPAAQKAVTFNPSEHGAALMVELTNLMNRLQQQAAELKSIPELRNIPGGPFLGDEVRIGFRPLEQYRNSDEAKQTAEAVRVARAITLWRRIGLSKPSDRWQERACKLLAAVESLTEKFSSTPNELTQRWRKIARQDQDLAEVEHDVCSFLEARIMKRAPTRVEGKDNPSAYLLEPASESQSQQTDLPFYFWLFSRRDLRLKVQAAAALILLVGVGVVFVNDSWARSVRSASYQSILQGADEGNYLQVIEGAESFLSHPLIATNDAREKEVIEHYNKALVLWVARQPGEINPEVAARIERYQQLVGNNNGGSL